MFTTKWQLEKLLELHHILVEVLVEVAEDPHTPTNVLKKLAKNTDDWIAGCATMNPSTPSSIIEERLKRYCGVGGEEDEERIHMVGNPSLRLQVVRRLVSEDPAPEVREMAIMILAKRVANRSNVSSEQLWEVFKIINTFKERRGNAGIRIRNGKKALLDHPKFPHKRLKRQKKRK